ncbi:MAG: polysaccharide lyase beta-sandwich domain-containing protein [Parabacteroides sp.]|nr:polysaccharide lyase beta-sandwich domain-containing protein [Parabacteroides sp.]
MNGKGLVYILALCSFLLVSGRVCGQLPARQEIDSLTSRLERVELARTFEPDAMEQALARIRPDGSWADIDYDTVTLYYDAANHLSRLIQMTLAYSKTGSAYYHDAGLLDKIMLALDYFYRKQPVSKNWWHNDIGAPQNYMVVLLLLKNRIEKERLLHYASYLHDRTSNRSHQGKNRTWVSAITIYKGCIEDNYELIKTGFASIASTVRIVHNNDEEGIKADYSIHQHRPQLYSGGYGMGYMEDLAYFIDITGGLSFGRLFTAEKFEIITRTMFEGQMLFGFRHSYDFGTVGRGVSRSGALYNIPLRVLDVMIKNTPADSTRYESWKKHIEGGPFPSPGNKYFWRSAIMTHHGADYYLSAKINSIRNNGTEMLNGENLKGYYLPLGATNIVTTGEEYRDIFPVWDWTRIPGTTAVANPSTAELRWYHFGSNCFGGGVSTGKEGIIAYRHAYTGVEARKSYFFTGDAMVCLGAGIKAARTQMITTSVNQCFLRGTVCLNRNGKTEWLTESRVKADNICWVYHDGVGYLFPQQDNLVVQQQEQRGAWRDINEAGSPDTISRAVFSIWKEHGYAPSAESYCYIVMPARTLPEFEKEAFASGLEIIGNTPEIQAVRNNRQQSYGVVFYEAGTAQLETGLILSADKPLLVWMKKQPGGYAISVADPLYVNQEVQVVVSGRLHGKGAHYENGRTVITFKLPLDDYAGSTVTEYFRF